MKEEEGEKTDEMDDTIVKAGGPEMEDKVEDEDNESSQLASHQTEEMTGDELEALLPESSQSTMKENKNVDDSKEDAVELSDVIDRNLMEPLLRDPSDIDVDISNESNTVLT